jgi:DNA-binding MurR/RpiR family transcriptional regulator
MTTEEADTAAGTSGRRRRDPSRTDPGGTAPDVGVLVTIRSLLPNLAPVERRVAQAVLDDPGGVAWRSISELARSCGTSATSVVRFCRAIGLRGYPDLRLALAGVMGSVAHDDAAAVVAASSDIDPDDDPLTITKKIAYADAAAITETASRLDVGALVKVVDALAVANRIDIYGVGASGLVAVDLQIKLQRIARPAYAWPDPHMAATSAALRGKGDVAVGLSHTGTTVDTIDALTEARAHGATTVAITNFPWSPITDVADFVLLTAARETAFRSGAMTSRIAQLTVVDCLFVTLAQRDLPRTMDALERTFAAAQAKRVRRSRHPKPLFRTASAFPPGQPLTEPTRLARLIWRCEATNKSTTGSETITTPAASSVNCDSLEP